MKKNKKDTTFYILTGVVYAVSFGILTFLFNLLIDVYVSNTSIIIQSVCFGIFMSLFDLWQDKRQDRKNKNNRGN